MKKNGFTLIELLAVIVILAVIALIATPVIMGAINDAKKGAAKDAAYGVIKAVEFSLALEADENGIVDTTLTALDASVNVKGTKPDTDKSFTLVIVDGAVVGGQMSFDGIGVTVNADGSVSLAQ